DGAIRWLGDPIAKLVAGEKLLQPRALILADDAVTNGAKEIAQRRVDLWLAAHVKRLLGPLIELEAGEGLDGAARGVAFQLGEALGVLERSRVAPEVKGLDQNARGALRKLGVRFGAYYLFLPALLKPAPRVLALQLWALKNPDGAGEERLAELPQLAAAGRTSFVADKGLSRDILRIAGFRLCGERAVRVDILERLADLIRPAVAYRPGVTPGLPPPGAADGDGFVATVAMTSLTGCSGDALASILRSMGFESRKIKGPAITVPLIAPATPATPQEQPTAEAAEAPAPEAPAEAAPASEQAAPAEAKAEPRDPSAGDGLVAPEQPAANAAPAEEGQPAESPAAAASAEAASEPPISAAEAPEPASAEAESKAEAGETAAPAEETLIEVWRPVHHRRGERSAGHRRERPPAHARGGAGAPEAEKTRQRRGKRRERGGENRPPAQAPGIAAESHAATPSDGSAQKSDEAAKPLRGARNGPPRKDQRPAPQRPRREQPIDPNSPFAKLLALKAELEAKQRGE
ncbi:MAG TPA: helicase, partial [Roseiarcus sp.]|nr:helicase [Roseiarcus sp.]